MSRNFRYYRSDINNRHYDGEKLDFAVSHNNRAIQNGHFTHEDMARIMRIYSSYLLDRHKDEKVDQDDCSNLSSDDLAEAIQVYAAVFKATTCDVWIRYD